MTFSTLASPGVSLQGGGGSGGGGGGTPGGSNTQIQYNSSGTFAGASGLTTTTGTELTIASGTKTADAPVLNMSQTWNNAGVTFTGLKFNATDTASLSGSLLMDLQVGGSSRLTISKVGTLASLGSFSSYNAGSAASPNFWAASNTGILAFGVSLDAFLSRRGAANLRLGAADAAAPAAQTLSVQSVIAGTTNTAGANLTITGSQGTGTGAGGSIVFQVAPAGSSGTAQNALVDALTVNSSSTLIQKGVGYNWHYKTTTSQLLTFEANGVGIGGAVGGTGFVATAYNFASTITATPDLTLTRDTANTLALRNGANAQYFNVYGTYTDASNYTRGQIWADTGSFVLDAQSAGTGNISQVLFRVKGTDYLALNSSTIQAIFYKNVVFSPDNTYDIGASGATRPRNVHVAGTVIPGRGVTVAGLPTPSTGMIARVTDALAPTIGATVTGGGAAYALVNYNGANWTVIGI